MPDTCALCGQTLPADGGTLGNMLRAQRMKLKFTLRDVKRITNGKISDAYLSQIETGKVRDPSASMIVAISAALCLSVEQMLHAIDPTYPLSEESDHA